MSPLLTLYLDQFLIFVLVLTRVGSLLMTLPVLGTATVPWQVRALLTAAISLILVYLAYDEVYSSLKYLYAVWKKTGSSRAVWLALCGFPHSAAEEAARELVHLARSAA